MPATFKVVKVQGKEGQASVSPLLGGSRILKALEPEHAAVQCFPEVWGAEAECLEGDLYEVCHPDGYILGYCRVKQAKA